MENRRRREGSLVRRGTVVLSLRNGSGVSVTVSHAKEWQGQIRAVIPSSAEDHAL